MKNKFQIYSLILLILLTGVYTWRSDVQNLLKYGFGDWPTRVSSEKCPWVKKVFGEAEITAFIATCKDIEALNPATGYAMIFSDQEEEVVGKWVTNKNYEFKIKKYEKDSLQDPLSTVKEWYSKLTQEQQKVCEIQSVDVPVTYFPDGSPNFHERPNPTAHKTRYAIGIKSEIVKQIFDQYGGDPGGGQGRDYMCGNLVGTTWSAYPPYFEFDDRSPNKYLLIGSYAFEVPPIDLNSIRF